MLVSLNWLKEYVELDMPVEELERRLMMAGLNHEGTGRTGDDVVIDLEVTSNRPDCLGHIGIAREVAVLWDRKLNIPAATLKEGKTSVDELTGVAIECPELCYRYTARVIRGVRIGPSPDWLARRLAAVGVAVVNNVVDITNYVLLESGQPLHAFDFAKLAGGRIIVRNARKDERFEAIDHKTYQLEPGMCVIADAERSVALGGVMGGAETEVSNRTTDLLIEAAEFAPLSIRSTARKLNLHSPSSYRFERGVDPEGVDWASRRCCELILDHAGGELAAGVADERTERPSRQPMIFRFSQLERILGIKIDPTEVRKVFSALGVRETSSDDRQLEVVPPSWRRDLTREIDLVEEAGRIHGYDQIPEDVGVAMVASKRSDVDRVVEIIRRVLTAAGFNEAMTISAVDESIARLFSPWSKAEPVRCFTPVLRRADRLRRSLVPSLLTARRANEALANSPIELFEIAKVYLPKQGELPQEETLLTITSGDDYLQLKGVVEAVLTGLNPHLKLDAARFGNELFSRGAELRIGDQTLGFLGEVSEAGRKTFDLRGPACVAELKLATLMGAADLIRQSQAPSPYPAVSRDLNVEFRDQVLWSDVESVVRESAGDHLENVTFQEVYRDPERVEPGHKRLLFTTTLRSQSGTLTGEQADQIQDAIVEQLVDRLGGKLVI